MMARDAHEGISAFLDKRKPKWFGFKRIYIHKPVLEISIWRKNFFFINSNYTKWVSFLSSQLFVYFFRPYNLRRKSALRPSQSFDTMKSTTSSVVSDGDTMEAAASRTSTKDQLDLASDFPPLMAAAPSIGEIEPPKWVTPAAFKSSNTP